MANVSVPKQGWIKALRVRLGMQQSQLAERIGISRQGIAKLETSEQSGTIEIASLQRVAKALGFTFVYGFVPNENIDSTIKERARALAEKIVMRSEKHMRLEAQDTSSNERERRIKELAEELAHDLDKRIWSVDGKLD